MTTCASVPVRGSGVYGGIEGRVVTRLEPLPVRAPVRVFMPSLVDCRALGLLSVHLLVVA
jgi:hypothetical protein